MSSHQEQEHKERDSRKTLPTQSSSLAIPYTRQVPWLGDSEDIVVRPLAAKDASTVSEQNIVNLKPSLKRVESLLLQKRYKLQSWIAFIIIFTILVTLEVTCVVIAVNANPHPDGVLPGPDVMRIAIALDQTLVLYTANFTRDESVRRTAMILKYTNKYRETVVILEEYRPMFNRMVLIPASIELVLFFIVLIMVIVHRGSTVVKSRGWAFTVQAGLSSLGVVVFFTLLALQLSSTFNHLPPAVLPQNQASEKITRKTCRRNILHTDCGCLLLYNSVGCVGPATASD